MGYEILGAFLICGLALLPFAAFVVVLNLRQRVQRLEREVSELKGATGGERKGTDGATSAPPVPAPVGRPVPVPAPQPPRTATSSPATPSPAMPSTPVSAPTVAAAAAGVPTATPTSPEVSPPAPPAPIAPPPARRGGGFERMLGTRGLLWVGAILIALAGVFFFKWAIDNGWFGETARVVTGIVFGLGALGVAERIRGRSRSVAGGTAAAGIAVLYTTFLVATNIYGLFPLAIGSLCMAATTAVAVLLSLRYGPVIVIIGMIGGFLTPALLDVPDPSPLRLFGYLALLQLGVVTVARKRDWWWAGLAVLGGGAAWFVLWLLSGTYDPGDGTVLGFFALFGAATTIGAASRLGRGGDEWSAQREAIAVAAGWAGAIYAAFLLGISLDTGGYRLTDWLFIGFLGAGSLALGRLRADWDRVPWLAAITTAVLLLSGAAQDGDVPAWLVGAFGVLFACGGYALGWSAARVDRWAGFVAGVCFAYFVVARNVLWPDSLLYPNGMPIAWGTVATMLAVVLAIAAVPIARRRARLGGVRSGGTSSGDALLGKALTAPSPAAAPSVAGPAAHDRALAALTIGVVALLFIGASIDLEDWWLAVGWAVIAAGACWTARWLGLWALAQTAWPLAALVTLRLLVVPETAAFEIGPTPVANAALFGYGVPIAALLAAAHWASGLRVRRSAAPGAVASAGAADVAVAPTEKAVGSALDSVPDSVPDSAPWRRPWTDRAETRLSEALRWMALALTVLLVHLLVGHGFHGELGLWDPGDGRWAILEWTLHVLTPLGLALALRFAARRWPWRAVVMGGWLLAWWGLVLTVVTCLAVANPWANGMPVGPWRVLNGLLLLYGVPAVLCFLVARAVRPDEDRWLQRAAAALIGVLGFALLSLEVRQAFHGSVLTVGETTTREMYSYSLAWTIFGIALLGLGILRKLPAARYASLAVMIITVCKVFLFDVAGLTGLYRVFSFLGLGVSLLGLAYVYQRFVFRVAPEEEA